MQFPFRRSTCVAALAALAVSQASADTFGPPFGNSKATSEITTVDGESDTDDFVAPLLAGDTLTASVAATGKSALHPSVTLLDPSGADRTPALKVSANARSVSFTSFPADVTGNWTVRLAGADGTAGAYGVSFKVKGAKPFGTSRSTLGGGNPRTATHTFQATRGAKVTLSLAPLGKGDVVELYAASDPTGDPYPGLIAAAGVKKGVTSVKSHVITQESGTYAVTVRMTDDLDLSADYRLTISVAPQPRASGTKKLKPREARIAAQAAPQRVADSINTTLTGHNLPVDPAVRVYFGAVEATVQSVAEDGTSVTVRVPRLPAPSLQDVTIVQPDGQAFTRAGFAQVVAAPVIVALQTPGGADVRKLPTAGGDPLRVLGTGFDSQTRFFLGDEEVPVDSRVGTTQLRATSPVRTRSYAVVAVEDDFGRRSQLGPQILFPYPQWGEGDVGRLPAPSAKDSLAAGRAAAGDLDHDGRADDLVLGSPIRSYFQGFGAFGTRDAATRTFVEGAARTFTDTTDTAMPVPFTAALPFDTDDWNAGALALGDLDRNGSDDLLIAGYSDTFADGIGDGFLYGTNAMVPGVRGFTNDGTGNLTFRAPGDLVPPAKRADLKALDENSVERPLFGPYGDDRGDVAAMALGDLDQDGDLDAVVARGEYGFRRLLQDPSKVDFTQSPPRIAAADAAAFVPGPNLEFAYVAGTQILLNGQASGFRYVTETALPLSFGGYSTSYQGTTSPGFHADDVAIAFVNGDALPDLVLTWHNPTTVSVRGLKSRLQSEWEGADDPVSIDGPRIATRVLLNAGGGRFTDVTDTWLPAGGTSAAGEWWQGDRLAVTDLDGDGAPDIVLASREGSDAWTTTALAAVTATPDAGTSTPGTLDAAETDTFTFTVGAPGRYVLDVAPGTLADPKLALYGPNSSATFVEADDDGGDGTGARIVRELAAGTWYAKVTAFSAADSGTYSLTVRGRAAAAPPIPRTRPALRVLRNDRANQRFVDVTATAIPAVIDGDDWRGAALRVADLDGDGRAEILVGTTEALATGTGGKLPSLRLFRGGAGLVFAAEPAALPPVAVDTGEAEDIVLLPNPDGYATPSIALVSRVKPAVSPGGRYARILDWNR